MGSDNQRQTDTEPARIGQRSSGMRAALLAMLVFTALPAAAANGPWTPAPTPNVGVNDHVIPSARAGEATGSARDAPFSAIPTDSVTGGGATSSNTVNGAQAPDPSTK